MYKARNLSESYFDSSNSVGDIRIFVSHISIDKKIAKEIGDYIMNAGFDIYLDINDEELQKAVVHNDALTITKCIERRIMESTHIMCLVSKNTVNSWWVPYEIGYGKRANKNISSLLLKDTPIPEYLKVADVLVGIKSLNKYLEKLLSENGISGDKIYKSDLDRPGYLLKYYELKHPLKEYLHWDK